MNLLIIPSWYDTPDNPVRGIFFKEQAQALSEYFKANNIVATVTILALQQYNIREAHLYKNVPKITVSQEAGITTIRSRFFHIPKVEEINLRRGAAFLKKLISYAGKVTGLEFSLTSSIFNKVPTKLYEYFAIKYLTKIFLTFSILSNSLIS